MGARKEPKEEVGKGHLLGWHRFWICHRRCNLLLVMDQCDERRSEYNAEPV